MHNNRITLSALVICVTFLAVEWESASAIQNPAEEAQAEFETVVPEGTVIPIVLTAYLNTRSSQVGDTVYADTTYPIWVQQRLVIPKGSTIRGTVTAVERPGRIKGKGRIAIRFDDILLPNGVKRDFVASFRGIHGPGEESLDRKSESVAPGGSGGEDAGTIVGTTSQGAIIGAIAGQGSGAAIGAGAGAAAGIATVLFTRGRDLVLSPGTQFDLELKRAIKFAYNELEFSDAELANAERSLRSVPTKDSRREPNYDKRRTFPFPRLGIPGVPVF